MKIEELEEYLNKKKYVILFAISTIFFGIWLYNSPTIRSSIDVKMEVNKYYANLDKEKAEFIEQNEKNRKEEIERKKWKEQKIKDFPRLKRELAELELRYEIERSEWLATHDQNEQYKAGAFLRAAINSKRVEISEIEFIILLIEQGFDNIQISDTWSPPIFSYGDKYFFRYYNRREFNRIGYNASIDAESHYAAYTDDFDNFLNAWDGMKVLFWFSFETIFSDQQEWSINEQLDRYAHIYGAVASTEYRGVHNTVDFILNFGYRLGGFIICYSFLILLLSYKGFVILKSASLEYYQHIVLLNNHVTKKEYKVKYEIIKSLIAQNRVNLKKYQSQPYEPINTETTIKESDAINPIADLINRIILENLQYEQKIKELRSEMMEKIHRTKLDDSRTLREENLKKAYESGILTKEEYENKLNDLNNTED